MHVRDHEGALVKCPDCQSTDVRYSDRYHILDLVMWFRRRHSLRCRKCRNRFYAPTDEAKNMMWVNK